MSQLRKEKGPKFLFPLVTKEVPDKEFFVELVSPLEYRVGHKDSLDIIHVPAGFQTDYNSIPQFLWSILPPHGKGKKAAVIHDWLFKNRRKHGRSRRECDRIHFEANGVLGVAWWKRHSMYNGLKLFSWWSWNKN